MRLSVDKTPENKTREFLWNVILKKREFNISELQIECPLDKTTIYQYIRLLEKAGYVEVIERGTPSKGKENRYRLIRPVSEPPRLRGDGSHVTQGIGRQNMWRTMRIRKVFTLDDLVALSSTDHKVSPEEAETYMKFLEKAGYIKNTDGKSRPKAAYRLIKDTGPKPPMIQRIKRVWDPNLREVVWPN